MPISDRWIAAGVLTLVAACSDPGAPTGNQSAAPGKTTAPAIRIACGHDGGALDQQCGVEQTGRILTIRHADGGFRRLTITDDGRGVIAADGAEPVRAAVASRDAIDVTIGNDRYRLPATIRPR